MRAGGRAGAAGARARRRSRRRQLGLAVTGSSRAPRLGRGPSAALLASRGDVVPRARRPPRPPRPSGPGPRRGHGSAPARRELERAGVSAAGFSALVVLTTAGGTLELRILRRRFGWSKANATEVTETLEGRGFVERHRLPEDRRAVDISSPRAAAPWWSGLPGARRTGQRGLRRAGRRREALARRDLPQARRLGEERSPIADRASTAATPQIRPKCATQIVASRPLNAPVERPTPIQRHSPDRITSRCRGAHPAPHGAARPGRPGPSGARGSRPPIRSGPRRRCGRWCANTSARISQRA